MRRQVALVIGVCLSLLSGCDRMHVGVFNIVPPAEHLSDESELVLQTLDRVARVHGMAVGTPAQWPRIPGCTDTAVRCYDFERVSVPAHQRGSWKTIVVAPCEVGALCRWQLFFSAFPAASEDATFAAFRTDAIRELRRYGVLLEAAH